MTAAVTGRSSRNAFSMAASAVINAERKRLRESHPNPRGKMKRRSFLFRLGAFGVAACSPAPAPVSTSASDPSNPNAAEGVPPAVPAAGTAPAAGTLDPHAGHSMAASADAGSGETVYVCPMHPEVTSTKPGSVCPKCGMKMVPEK